MGTITITPMAQSQLVTNINAFISKANSQANPRPEVEFRFTERGVDHGISYSTYKQLMFMKITQSDESHISSDSLIYIDRNTRYIFTDNSEHMVAEIQTKNQLYHLFSNGAPIPYKLSLSVETPQSINPILKTFTNTKIASDIMNAYQQLFSRINGGRRILVIGRDAYLTEFLTHSNTIHILDGIPDDLNTFEDMDMIIDNNYILNYCNKDGSSLSSVYSTINKSLKATGIFISIRFSDNTDVADKKHVASRVQFNRKQYRLYMYRYNLAMVNSSIFDSVEMDEFINTTKETLPQYVSHADKSLYVRQKHTETFIMGYYMIELSTVCESGLLCRTDSKITYELELEFLIRPALSNIYKPVEYIYNYLFSNGRIACPSMFGIVSRYIRRENKPINITHDNLPNISTINDYAVTNKTNGIRYYMLSHNGFLYLSSFKESIKLCQYTGPSVLFDGELVSNSYWIIDTIMYNNVVVQGKYLRERQSYIHRFIEHTKVSGYILRNKEYYYRGSLDKRIMDAIEYINTQCRVENDGLILTSTREYNNTIYKLKYDMDTNTIDFYIDNQYAAYVYDTSPKNMVRYKHAPVVISTFTDPKCIRNTICECRYDSERKVWIAIRIRFDKHIPNHVSVANNIWQQIHNPLSVSYFLRHICMKTREMCEKSHSELRRYNNIVKRQIILKYARGSLLDLGSGVGGDIPKYIQAGITNMILTEPSIDKMPELHSRIDGLKLNSNVRVQVENVSVQNLELTDTYDTISSFFMLSFFYDSEQTLDVFANVIESRLKTNGYFIGTMIDNYGKQYDGMYDGDIEIKRDITQCSDGFQYGTKVSIKFPGCLNQTEYESSFDELYSKLKVRGIQLVESSMFESRDYLSSDENRYVSLYRWFVFKKVSSDTEIVDYHIASPAQALLYAANESMDILTNITVDTVKPVFRDMMIQYATNLGIDDFNIHKIKIHNLKLFDIHLIDTLNMHEITNSILGIYKDLIRLNPVFTLNHVCRAINRNVIIYSGEGETKVTICSAFDTVDIECVSPSEYRVI